MPQVENIHPEGYGESPATANLTTQVFLAAAAPIISSAIDQGFYDPVQQLVQFNGDEGGDNGGDAKVPAWVKAHQEALKIFKDKNNAGEPLPKAVIINLDDEGEQEVKIVPKD